MQTISFLANQLSWARTGQDAAYHYSGWGKFPVTAGEQRGHIRGVIVREGVGKGDEEWLTYLKEMGAIHGNQTIVDEEALGDEDEYVGVTRACLMCT